MKTSGGGNTPASDKGDKAKIYSQYTKKEKTEHFIKIRKQFQRGIVSLVFSVDKNSFPD